MPNVKQGCDLRWIAAWIWRTAEARVGIRVAVVGHPAQEIPLRHIDQRPDVYTVWGRPRHPESLTKALRGSDQPGRLSRKECSESLLLGAIYFYQTIKT
jgi:hypothetical protein